MLADTADYGVCRILCNQPDKAYDILSKEGFTVNKTPVLAIALDDQPGHAADAIACFAEGGSAFPTFIPSSMREKAC